MSRFKWLWGAAAVVVLGLLGTALFVTHGTIEGGSFCNTCHATYYDAGEYAFNAKVGVTKPAGLLTGCAECHPKPYAEFRKSAHFETQKVERRPGCANCHNEPHRVLDWYNFMYWQPEAWKRVQLSISDNAFWEKEVRPQLAHNARAKFVASDSGACRGCHNVAAKTWRPNIKAHVKAVKTNETCINCHFNLVHAEVPWPDKDKK